MDISCVICVWIRESMCSLVLRNCRTDKLSIIVVLVLVGVILIVILVLVLIYL